MEAKDIRARARRSLEKTWGIAIGVALLACLFGAMLTGTDFLPEINISGDDYSWHTDVFGGDISISFGTTDAFFGLAAFILGGVVQLGYCQFLLKQHDGQNPEFNDLFSKFDFFGQGFAQHFLRGLYTFLWSLLFVIPGIVKSYAYAMTPFIMAENPEMTASEAITASKELMDGHKGELFWLDLTFLGWSLLCLLTLDLGHIALNPYKNAAYAAFYRSLIPQIPQSES